MSFRQIVGILAALAGLLWVQFDAGCSRRETRVQEGRRTGTLNVAIGAEPGTLDPQRQELLDEMCVGVALFEGLTWAGEKGTVPAAAEHWSAAPDGLSWTFHLREGLRWSDGSPLTAEDFAWSLRRALSPKLASEYAYLLFSIRGAEDFNAGRTAEASTIGVRALDARTLQIELARPCPQLPAILAQPIAFPVPRHVIEALAAQGEERRWTDPGRFVGNGPFVLAERSPNRRIVTVRNPQFHSPARLQRLVFYPFEQASAQEAAFRAGQLHVTSAVPTARIAGYRAEQPSRLRSDPLLESNFLRFNTTRPPLNDSRVRQALTLALDRRELAERVLPGGQPAATGLVPPGIAGYTASLGSGYDLERARQALADAGFPGGHGLPPLEVMGFSSDVNQKVLEALQESWRKNLGIAVTIAVKDKAVWYADERRFAYQISLGRWIADYADPGTFLDLFLSNGGNNATGWSDAEYDNTVLAAGSEANAEARATLYHRAESILLRAQPVAPLYYGTKNFLIDPSVRGWDPAPLGLQRYEGVWLE